MLSNVQLFLTPWTIAHQAPLSMGFPTQEYWSGFSFPPPEDLPNPGNLNLLHGQTDSLTPSHLGSPNISIEKCKICYKYL